MSYYRKFGIIIGSHPWRMYLRWVYKKCLSDVSKLGVVPDFSKKDFSCLLCGAGNEATADEFIKFVISRCPGAKIYIIDLGEEQIKAVERLVEQKYSSLRVEVRKINALNLRDFIKADSIDWIETDAFWEYFDKTSLKKLLLVWKDMLKIEGFITTRAFCTQGQTGMLADKLRIWIGKVWIGGLTTFPHGREELKVLFQQVGFRYIEGPTVLPTFRRFSLCNKEI